jgi:hypothetical protein
MRTRKLCKAARQSLMALLAIPALASCQVAKAQHFALAAVTTAAPTDEVGGAALSAAVDTQALSTVRIANTLPAKPSRRKDIEELPSRRAWMVLSLVQHGAATFDSYSTRQAIEHGAVEADPLMRPFAQSPAIYAAIQVGPALLDYAARRMQRSNNILARSMWWVPQSGSTVMFLFSGVHNLHVAGEPLR